MEAARADHEKAWLALEDARLRKEQLTEELAIHSREAAAWELLETKEVTEMDEEELVMVAMVLHELPDSLERLPSKSELHRCLQETKDLHLSTWVTWRRRNKTETESLMRQQNRLAELKREQSAKEEVANEEASAREHALAQVREWALDGDLCTFLERCGVSISGDGSDRGLLQKAYRKMMLKYHPDRMGGRPLEERVLAEEITKHVTSSLAQIDAENGGLPGL
jgi:hypothetical protein